MKEQKLSNRELSELCRSLSLLLHAGVGIGDGLALLEEETDAARTRKVLREIVNKMDEGESAAAAFRAADCFPVYVCGLVEMGERSGRMEEALGALAEYYDGRVRMEQQLRSALLYPAIMMLVMLVVVVVLLAKVLPVFSDVYANLGGELTGVAGGLLAIGIWLDRAMPFLCALLALVVVAGALFALCDPLRSAVVGVWNRRMGDRGISRKMNTARFAQSLYMGLCSGMPMEDSIDLAGRLLEGIPAAQARVKLCQDKLFDGTELSRAMQDAQLLPKSECRLLALGQRSGASDKTMGDIAERLTEEAEQALQSKVAQIEPTLVIAASVLVGLILLSVMLPLMHIMAAIG